MATKPITDAAARAALKCTGVRTLTDPGPRGAGRLALIVKQGRGTWYAVHYQAGARRLQALGTFPAMSVAAAREAFGSAPTTRPARDLTFGALVEVYLDWRKEHRPRSYRNAKQALAEATAVLGRKLAADVTPADVVGLLRGVYDRGSRGQADKLRGFVKAAFQWALEGQNDYTRRGAKDWGLRDNPVAAVPRDRAARGVGQRWLSPGELAGLLRWMLARPEPSARCMAVLALTGQRVREITQLRAEQWDGAERVLRWETTKTGKPHSIPVCELAARLLDGSTWEPVHDDAMLAATRRHAARAGIPYFTPRDLRRTWTTLAGEAGLTERERRLLQNHSEGSGDDVQARHYDRAEYLPEKRAAVEKWEAWLQKEIRAEPPSREADQVIGHQQ